MHFSISNDLLSIGVHFLHLIALIYRWRPYPIKVPDYSGPHTRTPFYKDNRALSTHGILK